MAIKFKFVDLLTGTSHVGAGAVSGEARGYIPLGGEFGIVHKVEFKGDDAGVDVNNTLALTDAAGRAVMLAKALDAGDTTSDEYTQQQTAIGTTVAPTVSTVGVEFALGYPEALYVDDNATRDASANTEGMIQGVFAKSPLLVTIAAGTDGDWQRVGVFVEV